MLPSLWRIRLFVCLSKKDESMDERLAWLPMTFDSLIVILPDRPMNGSKESSNVKGHNADSHRYRMDGGLSKVHTCSGTRVTRDFGSELHTITEPRGFPSASATGVPPSTRYLYSNSTPSSNHTCACNCHLSVRTRRSSCVLTTNSFVLPCRVISIASMTSQFPSASCDPITTSF